MQFLISVILLIHLTNTLEDSLCDLLNKFFSKYRKVFRVMEWLFADLCREKGESGKSLVAMKNGENRFEKCQACS